MAHYYKSQAHINIDLGYDTAISYFAQKKRAFLQSLEGQTNMTLQNFMTELNAAIEQELDQELEADFDTAFSGISSYLEDWFVKKAMGENPSYQELVEKFDQLLKKEQTGKVDPKREYDNMKKHIEQFLAINNIDKTTITNYVASITSLGNKNNTDIQNNLFGYARRIILQQLRGQELSYATNNYKNSIKGYYKEELLTKALQKIMAQYNLTIVPVGSVTNEKGQQIQTDIGILKGTFSDPTKALQTFVSGFTSQEASGSAMALQPFGGIQSKSWVAPWTNSSSTNRNWLSIGSHADLMPKGSAAYYWHAGVNNVMKNLINVIGSANFIYSTGDSVYFTSEMLSQFRQAQYVFGFYKRVNDKIVDAGVGAMLHEDA